MTALRRNDFKVLPFQSGGGGRKPDVGSSASEIPRRFMSSFLFTVQSVFVRTAIIAFCLLFLGGCQTKKSNGTDIVRVSGIVTLDGEPLADANLVFIPFQASGEQDSFAPISVATTDAQGNYLLRITEQTEGAVVGWHYVLISKFNRPQSDEPTPATEPGSKPGDLPDRLLQQIELQRKLGRSFQFPGETLPSYYNSDSTLTFQVPREPTTNANFKLTTIDPLLNN